MLSIEGFQSAFKYIQLFKEGLVCTVSLSAFTVIFGFVLALMLALMRMADIRPFRFLDNTQGGEGRTGLIGAISRFRPLSFIASIYIEVFRAPPLMVQLFIVYYILLADLDLPSAPKKFLNYFEDPARPQTRLDRDFQNGFGVSIGRLREDKLFDYRFVCLSHNTVRGAAGGAMLTAELLCAKGYISKK